MIDTSVMVAALVGSHEFHALARPHLRAPTRIPAIVLAETYAQLRRTFAQPAEVVAGLMRPWSGESGRILPTGVEIVQAVFERAVELNLAGDIHDALIAQICVAAGEPLVTLDRRQHRVALALGAQSSYLLA